MSTRNTLYKHADESGIVHIFEDTGYSTDQGPGFFLYAFRLGDCDVCVKIPEAEARKLTAQYRDSGAVVSNAPWSVQTMQMINELTSTIEGKAFDPGWFELRQRFEQVDSLKGQLAEAQATSANILKRAIDCGNARRELELSVMCLVKRLAPSPCGVEGHRMCHWQPVMRHQLIGGQMKSFPSPVKGTCLACAREQAACAAVREKVRNEIPDSGG